MKTKPFPRIINHFICSLLITLLAALTALPLSSQTVVVSEDMRQTPDTRFGPGRKHFRHTFVGLHLMAGPAEEGAEIIYGRSQITEFGTRYKRQFSPVYAVGYDVHVKRIAFFPKQQESKLIPDTQLFDKEKLVYVGAGLAIYQRFNYGKRGDYIGRFIDMGAWGDWYFHTRHLSFYKEEGQNVRTRRTRLDYPSMLGYGLLLRLGFNNVVIKGSYRLSDMFDQGANLPEIPRFSLGLEMGMHSR
jgi:hypothetical protein